MGQTGIFFYFFECTFNGKTLNFKKKSKGTGIFQDSVKNFTLVAFPDTINGKLPRSIIKFSGNGIFAVATDKAVVCFCSSF